MAKVKCPVSGKELNVPADCPKDCIYLAAGECVNPLAGVEQEGGFSGC